MKIFYAVLFITFSLYAQESVDQIAAVVGDEIITRSQIENELSYFAAQRRLDPKDKNLRKQLIESKIEEKLLYAQAELDSIEISDEEVISQIDYQMQFFIQQYGSEDRIEEAYGMSIDRIKRELREETRKNLMAQRVRQIKFGSIEVTRQEVEEFFEVYKDSLGFIPEKLTLAHIFINPRASEKIQTKAENFAKSLLDSLKNGADFSQLAKKYSDDPGSAVNGGELGFVKRGRFFPEFESVAFALEENQLSDVVKSPVGYHIIQLLERRGESINTRHILIKPENDDDSDLEAIEFLSGLRDSIITGVNSFEFYAERYSDDKESYKIGGELGVFEISQLEKPLLETVKDMEENEISYPKRLDLDKVTYGFHIVKLIKRVPEHKPELDVDYKEIKQLVEFKKREEFYKKWLAELKEKIYWEIRI